MSEPITREQLDAEALERIRRIKAEGVAKRSVRKGKNFERFLAKKLEAASGQRVFRTPQSGAAREISASDMMGVGVGPNGMFAGHAIEAKNQKQINFRRWWDQAKAAAEDDGKPIPTLVMNLGGGEVVVAVPIDAWLDLHKEARRLSATNGEQK